MSSIEGNPTERAFFILLIAVGLAIVLKRGHRISLPFKENSALYLFVLFMILSAAWAPFPDIVLKRWLRSVGDIIMAMVILTEDDQGEAVEHILRRCAICLLPLSIVFIRFFGNMGIGYSIGGERMWTGVTTNKNELGFLCAYLGVFLVWRIVKAWPRILYIDGFLLLQALYLLRGSRSATSAVVFMLGVIILIFFMRLKGDSKKIKKWAIAALLVLLLFQGLATTIFENSLSSLFFSLAGRNSTFTGRTPLWQTLIEIGSKKPILGTGFGNFWVVNLKVIWSKFAFHPVQGHNGYLDVFLDLGIVGLALLLLLIYRTYKRCLEEYARRWQYATLMFVMFIMVLFHNFTEATIAKPTNLLWAIFLFSAISVKMLPRMPVEDTNSSAP
jgi:exopolysaccharide production protein ExoQ